MMQTKNERPMTIDELIAEITRLKGEARVMRDLLRATWEVIDTIDGESAPECEALMQLQNQLMAEFKGSI